MNLRNLLFNFLLSGLWLVSVTPTYATGSTQQLIVRPDPLVSFKGILTAYEYHHHAWHAASHKVPIVLGRNGIAAPETKQEGDEKTPGGIFKIGPLFGTENNSTHFKMSYIELTPTTLCIDDSQSSYYNHIVDTKKILNTDWKSAEEMKTISEYQLGAVILYNKKPILKKKGSCIFIHRWKNANTGTAGCIAMSDQDLQNLLRWLDPRKQPDIKILNKV